MHDHNDHDDPFNDELDAHSDEAPPPPAPALDAGDELPDGVEYLGSYPSITDYLRAMLEPEVTTGCAWILDHLDYDAIRRRWECDGSRLVLECGHVYRVLDDAAS